MPSVPSAARSHNLGNAVLAGRDASTGAAKGVTVDLAGELAGRLGVPLELVVVDGAAKSVDAVVGDRADVGFFAIDPQRGADNAFTPPYVLIEGCYLVRADSPLHANEEVDRAGHVVVVGQGSAYDLHLTRALQHATIVRAAFPVRQVTKEQAVGWRCTALAENAGAPNVASPRRLADISHCAIHIGVQGADCSWFRGR